jgi:CheY-like chemotaxis protein
MMDEYIGNDDLRQRLQQVVDNVNNVRRCLRQVAEGPHNVLGAGDVKDVSDDPVLGGAEVLVADDEANIRTTISDVLRKYRVVVTAASNGAEAIVRIEQRDRPFDLIISDIKMPDRSGYDVFAAARRKSATVPVILMTAFGYDPNHSIVRASQEGLQAVLFKPFKVEQFLGEVRKALQSQPASR